ncbi:hypothetical protein NKH69_00345 [Mesorhizobium sp. M0976]|uniref:hypothetical protein n=1 Tax=Mesorhizobium sp. M0976 TaxID=2957038 RepID=UPI0033370B0E
MDLFNLRVLDIENIDDVTVRGVVEIKYRIDEPDGGRGLYPTVSALCFVSHDGASTLPEVEAALLKEARRLLSETLSVTEAGDPKAIRQAVAEAKADRDVRRSAALAASLEADLKTQ